MSRAADYGQPKLRVRLVSQTGKWLFRRSTYAVEYSELGARQPTWTRETTDPVGLLRPFLGLADAHAVVAAADKAAGGQWSSLFDEDARRELPA